MLFLEQLDVLIPFLRLEDQSVRVVERLVLVVRLMELIGTELVAALKVLPLHDIHVEIVGIKHAAPVDAAWVVRTLHQTK